MEREKKQNKKKHAIMGLMKTDKGIEIKQMLVIRKKERKNK